MTKINVKSVEFVEKDPQEVLGESVQGENQDGDKGAQDDDSGEGVQGASDDLPGDDAPDSGDSDDDDLDDARVISYFAKKHNKELSSIDELFVKPEPVNVDEMLPSDVSAFYKFKKETGRGLEDFVKVNRSYESEPSDKVLKEYIKMANPTFDDDDVASEYAERFEFDEDEDDPSEIKRKKRELKKEYSKALEFFNTQKQKYAVPVESTSGQSAVVEDEDYKQYKNQLASRAQEAELATKRSDAFVSKTNEVFSNESKGFEFKIGEKSLVWKPANLEKAKSDHLNIASHLGKFVDKETGIIKDAVGYHKAMAMAMNPDYFANFFYEQGKAEAIENSASHGKNVNMVRNTPQDTPRTGMVVKALDDSAPSGKIVIKKK